MRILSRLAPRETAILVWLLLSFVVADTSGSSFSQGMYCFSSPEDFSYPTAEINDLVSFFSGPADGSSITTVMKVFRTKRLYDLLHGGVTLSHISPYYDGQALYPFSGLENVLYLKGSEAQDMATYEDLLKNNFQWESKYMRSGANDWFKKFIEEDVICSNVSVIDGGASKNVTFHCPVHQNQGSLCIYTAQFITPDSNDTSVFSGNLTSQPNVPLSPVPTLNYTNFTDSMSLSTYLSNEIAFVFLKVDRATNAENRFPYLVAGTIFSAVFWVYVFFDRGLVLNHGSWRYELSVWPLLFFTATVVAGSFLLKGALYLTYYLLRPGQPYTDPPVDLITLVDTLCTILLLQAINERSDWFSTGVVRMPLRIQTYDAKFSTVFTTGQWALFTYGIGISYVSGAFLFPSTPLKPIWYSLFNQSVNWFAIPLWLSSLHKLHRSIGDVNIMVSTDRDFALRVFEDLRQAEGPDHQLRRWNFDTDRAQIQPILEREVISATSKWKPLCKFILYVWIFQWLLVMGLSVGLYADVFRNPYMEEDVVWPKGIPASKIANESSSVAGLNVAQTVLHYPFIAVVALYVLRNQGPLKREIDSHSFSWWILRKFGRAIRGWYNASIGPDGWFTRAKANLGGSAPADQQAPANQQAPADGA